MLYLCCTIKKPTIEDRLKHVLQAGTWTRTPSVAANRILSPACLPIPPPGRRMVKKSRPAFAERGNFEREDRLEPAILTLAQVVLYQMSYSALFKNYFLGVQNRVLTIPTKIFSSFFIYTAARI